MKKRPGFVSVELIEEIEQPSRYQMVIRLETSNKPMLGVIGCSQSFFAPPENFLYFQ